jgi:AAA family ATP:ADP antiporter
LILLYGFVLYPNANKVSPHTIADALSIYTAGKHLHWIAVFRHWIHVLFFVVAELWGQIALTVLYWSFVNSVCTIQDAKRFYALLIAAGDVALISTAPLIIAYTQKYSHIDFLCTVQVLIGYVTFFCLIIIFIYYLANRSIKRDIPVGLGKTSTKLQLSLWDSLKHVASSRYLVGVAIMVVSCGLSINIVEGIWKSYLKELFPKAADYQSFVSECTFWTGIIALIFSLFFSGGMLRKFGWKATARVTPVVVGVMGQLFFLMSYIKNNVLYLTNWLEPKLILYIAIFGGIQNVIAKAVKYAFFDKTAQMAYIPLDPETKIKGKAAVDLLGSRLGKAGSSWIQIALLEIFHTNSIQPLSGVLFIFLLITTICWYQSIDYVDKKLTLLEV